MTDGILDRIVPQKRCTPARAVGNAVVFLFSESGRYVTGTVMPVAGGIHLKR